jgi:hypothetical protein
MSIEQKIAELLAESRKTQEIQEEKVKPEGAQGGSNTTTQNAHAGDKSGNPSKGDAVKPAHSGENPDVARNNVTDEKQAEEVAGVGAQNPKNGDQTSIRKGDAVKAGVKEDMDALFTGEELTEEFKEKATTIFEAAVMVRVNEEVARLEEEFAAQLQEATAQQIEGLVEQVDGYLGYIAEQWIANNELALENGIKSEIVESFINGMKGLFEEHYIDVPAEKYDVLGEMEQTIGSLEAKLDEQVAANVALTKQVAVSTRSQIVAEAAEGLSDVEAEKFEALAEELTFESAESFSTKVKTIRESYFTKQTTEVKSVVTDTPVENLNEEVTKKIDPQMAAYLSALTK